MKKREVLRMDVAGGLKRALREIADELEQQCGEKVSMASVGRRILIAGLANKAVRRQAGVR